MQSITLLHSSFQTFTERVGSCVIPISIQLLCIALYIL